MNPFRYLADKLKLEPPQSPAGFQLALKQGGDPRPQIFDPSVQHFPNGFRRGDPQFETPELAAEWYLARRKITAHILQVIHDSPYKDNLILRGSTHLKAILGDAAREPGDIDFVVAPDTITLDDPWSLRLFDSLPGRIAHRPLPPGLRIDTANAATDDIWTYDRSPGRRIVLPWQADGLPAATIQIDFTFEEPLPDLPRMTPIPVPDGDPIPLLAATAELSLAWKLLWLETDMHPQGKDLYDATLLAERTQLRLELLQKVFERIPANASRDIAPHFPMLWEVVDWDEFLHAPPLEGDAEYYKQRLTNALAPTFAPR